jgi:hypothetical protein
MTTTRRVSIGSTGGEPKGDDVMDELLGGAPGGPAAKASKTSAAPAESSTRKRMTVYVEETIQEELRAAAYWTRENLSDLVEQAIVEKIRALEAEHNGGEPFSVPPERPKRGRPVGRR